MHLEASLGSCSLQKGTRSIHTAATAAAAMHKSGKKYITAFDDCSQSCLHAQRVCCLQADKPAGRLKYILSTMGTTMAICRLGALASRLLQSCKMLLQSYGVVLSSCRSYRAQSFQSFSTLPGLVDCNAQVK